MDIRPVFCCLVITDKCVLKCKMCHIWKKNAAYPAVGQPGIIDWKRFIKSLRKFINGELCIIFAGGEVLISEETLELVSYATGLGFDTLINSNAYLINEALAKSINDARLRHIYISLDSLNEDTHDFLRGTKGVYARVMKAIEFLHSCAVNLRIHINTVIMEKNLDDIVDLAEWVIRDDRLSSIHFQAVTQPFGTYPERSWFEKKEYGFLWPKDKEKLKYIMDELIRLKTEHKSKIENPVSQFRIFKAYFMNPPDFVKKLGCHIYKQSINVNPFGEVYICYDMDSIGNIKEEGFDVETVWYSPKADLVKYNIKNCRKNCQAIVNYNYDEQELYID